MQAFYVPNKDKPNFLVLCDALALRLVIASGNEDGKKVVTAVEFECEGSTHVVHVKKDAVLCAGFVRFGFLIVFPE